MKKRMVRESHKNKAESQDNADMSKQADSPREAALEKLRIEDRRFRAFVEHSSDIIVIINLEGNITYINPAVEKVLGFKAEERIGAKGFELVHPDDLKFLSDSFNTLATDANAAAIYGEMRLRHKDGSWRTFEAVGSNLVNNNVVEAVIVNYRDITERKSTEEALKKSEANYRNIFENAMEGIYQSTMEGSFITVNAAFARMAGYDSPEKLINSVQDIGAQLYVHPGDRKRFLEIRAENGFVEKFETEFYKKDGSTFWVVINARVVRNEEGKVFYTEGLIEDITLRKHAEEKLYQSLDSLKKAINTTVQVLVFASEARDPYTAGHQARSAHLACAIATEMGLGEETIDGIHMVGIIHDIGKLSIPAEILTKPIKLTNLEFSLIKEHSRSGYEMLKDVESPWPLAEIVYQHHERMDGSGYPRNLKGDEILIEARILAVADVVEAMASHRPYRASLGMEAALKEIEKNKAILYDDDVADACRRLFREKGYQLA
jgi:PAS domain S-box-containing protein